MVVQKVKKHNSIAVIGVLIWLGFSNVLKES